MMNTFLQITYWFLVFLIFYSYAFYPIILKIISNHKNEDIFFKINDKLPKVSVLLAVFNEEEVIAAKMESMINSNFPINKLDFFIGSDNSYDRTNEIVENYSKKHKNIKFVAFKNRQGKQSIINKLYELSEGEIIIITDANIMFDKNTIFELVKYFKNQQIGLVDSKMLHKGIESSGISKQESTYISLEQTTKNLEGKLWGTMMGPFGGCYALRKKLYTHVPINFMVDDFFISMKVLEQGYKTVNSLSAKVYEDVSNDLNIEFKRKIRIATGNYQNLGYFWHMIFGILQKNSKNYINRFGLSFSFLSHKILRWKIPFMIIIIFIINIFLINNLIYKLTLFGIILSFLLPFLDFILKKINLNISLLRFITHFYSMNLALIIGFFKFLKGVKSGIWQPTKRNQTNL